MLITWQDHYMPEVIALWNAEMVKDSYKEMTEESLGSIIWHNHYFDKESTFLWLEDGVPQGFGCGCTGSDLPYGDVAGYITCLTVGEGVVNRDDVYAALLTALEGRFRSLGKSQAEVLFFNPMQLPWYVPNTPGHEHNNAPGVPAGSELHKFLGSVGYAERAIEHAMYMRLDSYEIPDSVPAKEERAGEAGYSVALYDPECHSGVEEMLAALGNPLWSKDIADSVAGGVPFLVAAHAGRAVGFAGPLIRSESGRGYFTGIGVMQEHEGRGLGSLLFFRLCEAFRDIGADYMSLYTGSTNPAIGIYEKAGFETVKEFAVMRRELGS
ncbi:GNAT family N-acetyltransferase [Paenibacillus sp. J5C_2022]|uniref:GNAT family N-acetyltransferase n=1 Tax=Paenibacillus sp. J5C2022 TaxID=2977129 RepID=UPI0021D0455A|nr:GNAT family N-acetyltransferase [Paenibacillus sp. J5C2022]MCU6708621.1 GNAT family N-acetyltransferase [Paenibacillus sp. J5C2022]